MVGAATACLKARSKFSSKDFADAQLFARLVSGRLNQQRHLPADNRQNGEVCAAHPAFPKHSHQADLHGRRPLGAG